MSKTCPFLPHRVRGPTFLRSSGSPTSSSVGRMNEVQPHIDDSLRIGPRDAQIVARAYALASNAAFIAGDDEKAYALAQRAVAEGADLRQLVRHACVDRCAAWPHCRSGKE